MEPEALEDLLAEAGAAAQVHDLVVESQALAEACQHPALDLALQEQLVQRRVQLAMDLRDPVLARRLLRWLLEGCEGEQARGEVLRGLAVVDDHLLQRPRRAADTYDEAASALTAAGLPAQAEQCRRDAAEARRRAQDVDALREWGWGRRAQLAVDVLEHEGRRLGQVRRVVDLGSVGQDLAHALLRQRFPDAEHLTVDRMPAGSGHVVADLATAAPLPRLDADLVHSAGLVHHLADRLPLLAAHVRDVLVPGGAAVLQFNVEGRLAARSRGLLHDPVPPTRLEDVLEAVWESGLHATGWQLPWHCDAERHVRQELLAWTYQLPLEDAAVLAEEEDQAEQYLTLGLVLARRPLA